MAAQTVAHELHRPTSFPGLQGMLEQAMQLGPHLGFDRRQILVLAADLQGLNCPTPGSSNPSRRSQPVEEVAQPRTNRERRPSLNRVVSRSAPITQS